MVVLDLALTPDLDVPAIDALTEIHGRLRAADSELWLAGLLPAVRRRLLVAGLVDQLGEEHLFNHVASALIAYLALHASDDAAARREVLTDLLEFIDTRRQHPGLDAHGLETLDAVADQLFRELELLPPDASPTPT